MDTITAVNLRLDRAGEHFEDLKQLVTHYEHSKPYTVSDGIEGEDEEHVYRLKFTSQPDDRIAVIAGDFLHNVRSALNYLMRGLVPSARKDKTQFPIFSRDPFARDPVTRKYVVRDPALRRSWNTYVEGADPRVLAYIKDIQPYSVGSRTGHIHRLIAVNWLSNSDKHRELIVTPCGLEDPERIIRLPNGTAAITPYSGRLKDGSEVFRSPTPVNVELDGTPFVLIRVGGSDRGEIEVDALFDTLLYVRGMIVGVLAAHLRR
jgi:hypothetical protein